MITKLFLFFASICCFCITIILIIETGIPGITLGIISFIVSFWCGLMVFDRQIIRAYSTKLRPKWLWKCLYSIVKK